MTQDQRGFPDGARSTPVPDLFFSRDLPALEDPLAVKVMLHAIWRLNRRQGGAPPALRVPDLVADPTLRRGAAALGIAAEAIDGAVAGALGGLVAAGLLLVARVGSAAGPERWLFVNNREGRVAFRRWQAGGLLLPELPPAVAAGSGERPNIFALYEDNIGLLTPILAEELSEAEAAFPRAWVEDAFRLAVAHNARNWAYVRAILGRWAREGRGDETDRRSDQAARERDIEGPYAPYIEH